MRHYSKDRLIPGTDNSDSLPNEGNYSRYTPLTPYVKMDDHLIGTNNAYFCPN